MHYTRLFAVFALSITLALSKPTPATNSGFLSVHMDKIEGVSPHAPLLQRLALRVDFKGMGLRVGKAQGREDAYKVEFLYGGDKTEGRKQKLNELIVPALLGFKTTTLIVLTISAVGLLVLKSLAIAKIAIGAAAGLALTKLLGGNNMEEFKHNEAIELDHPPHHLHPYYEDYSANVAAMSYMPTGGGNYVAYAPMEVNPEAEGEEVGSESISKQQYVFADASVNTTQQSIQRRRDSVWRKSQPIQSYITIRRKSVTQ